MYMYAENNLGVLYYNGEGVKQDYYKAKKYFESSAREGNPLAQYNLGVMYNKGLGVIGNYIKAKELFYEACERGHQDGCDSFNELNKK